MNEFDPILAQVRQDRADFFEPYALHEPAQEELTVEVDDFDVPDRKELEQREQIGRPDLPQSPDDSDDWWDLTEEEGQFVHDTSRAREEHEGFLGPVRRAHIDLLAVYLPFHLYPVGHWGVRFFERPMARFTDRLHRACLSKRLTYSWGQVLKIARGLQQRG